MGESEARVRDEETKNEQGGISAERDERVGSRVCERIRGEQAFQWQRSGLVSEIE